MPSLSAGCLVTRTVDGRTEILLVHARGATFRQPLFGIPKGQVEGDEELAATARRETFEETGLTVRIHAPLGSVKQKSGKLVHGFWATVEPESEAAIDAQGRCLRHDQENDVCRFYPIERAYDLMIPAQRQLLGRLRRRLEGAGA